MEEWHNLHAEDAIDGLADDSVGMKVAVVLSEFGEPAVALR